MKPTALVRLCRGGADRTLCCVDLATAFSSGTDNEAYGRLASAYTDDPASIHIGSELPAIAFCPWCGTPVKDILWDKEEV